MLVQQPQQPGKLNLKNFAIVNDAIARMNVNSDGGGGMSQSTSADAGRGKGGGLGSLFMAMGNGGGGGQGANRSGGGGFKKSSTNHSTFAPHNAAYSGLAGGEDQSDDDCDAEYAQVQEIYPGADGGVGMGMGGGGGGVGPEQQMYTFSQDATPNKGSKMRPTRNRIGGVMDKGVGQMGGSKWDDDELLLLVIVGVLNVFF